jgi:uncharacterized membrane protein required for colicin V production
MTWLDAALLVVWVVFIAVGARLGSLWTAGCLIGGFFGAFIADYYAIPLSDMMGGFAGSQALAGVLLFAAGVVAGLVPGWLLDKLSAAFLMGIINSFFGLVTGLLAGFLAVSLLLLWTVQSYSEIEEFRAWRKSSIAKPMHDALEHHFENHGFQTISFSKMVQRETRKRIRPLTEKAVEKTKDLSHDVVDRLKKE